MLYTYISHSRTPKTYHGVTFYYGDKKEVSYPIADRHFVFCSSRQTPQPIIVNQDVELSKSTGKSDSPITKDVPAREKPKSARGRKPKVAESVFEEPKVAESVFEEPTSDDTE